MNFPQLQKSIVWDALSEMGKEIFQPNGIFYWAGRAKKEAEIIGTIGAIVGIEGELVDNENENMVTYYIPAIKDFVDKDPGEIVPYAPITGLPAFRKHWQQWIIEKGKTAKNLPSGQIDVTGQITLPAVVPGITNGIFLSTKLFCTPGEMMISPNKRWGNYDSIITRHCGVTINSFNVFTEDMAFNIDGMITKMEESIDKQGKVVVILNFPNNPTGYLPGKEEAAKIVDALDSFAAEKKKPIVVLCDDAYEGYVYNDDGISASIFYELVGKNEYLIPIKLDGASKEMLMYGGRIGAVTLGLHKKWIQENEEDFLNEFENKLQSIVRSSVSNSNRFIQSLLAKMFDQGIEKVLASRQKIIDIVQERYALINDLLGKVAEKTDALSVDPNAGGFFLLINLDEKVKATDFNEHLLKEYKTGLIPIVKPQENINALRVAYSSIPKEKIPKLVENIEKAVKDMGL